jgi:class 3 adenylate cyclase
LIPAPLALAAALLLQPVLAEDGPLRLVAVGTGDHPVEWTLDGRPVARTGDGEAARVEASAGPHELWASSAARGHWRVLARPDPAVLGGAEPVAAWTAVHEAEPPPAGRHAWLLPVGAAAGSAALLARPRSLLQRWSRRRRA